MSPISDSWMQTLLAKSDIASILGEYMTLSPKGGKLWACCPFHQEKTASFQVDVSAQLYYCFGCHKGGNVITFIKEKENMTGIEAIKYLADKAGMELPDSKYSHEEAMRIKNAMQRLYNLNRDAARFFFNSLKSNPTPLKYLKDRGLSEEIIASFGLGYSPDSWNVLFDHLEGLGYSEHELLQSGLARKTETGKIFPLFRNRVMFPIIDEKGNVLAFGGRTLGSDKPKYVNTGDTSIYSKRRSLYAVNMLKKGTQSDIILTEGYMDVISLHAAGINNAIASLGTALTVDQAKLIKRKTTTVYVSYDGDSAGQAATLRGLDILANEGLEVRVICLPDNTDPDDFAKAHGKDGYMRLKGESMTLNTFKLEHMSKEYDLTSADGRQGYAIQACALVATLQPVEQERYYELISRKTGISYETLSRQGADASRIPEKRNSPGRARNNIEKAPAFAKTDRERFELTLIACAAKDAKSAEYVAANALEFLSMEIEKQFVIAAAAAYKQYGTFDIAAHLAAIDNGSSAVIAAAIFEQRVENPLAVAVDCVKRLSREQLNNELRMISSQLDSNEISLDEYKQRYDAIRQKISTLQ